MDPRIIYSLVQKILDMPEVLKEILVESEWHDISEKLYNDEDLKTCF
jgi:hypothetical protein